MRDFDPVLSLNQRNETLPGARAANSHPKAEAGMIAATYSRKSTPQPGVTDSAKSVARQTAEARAFIEKNGWTLDEAHVFVDDAVSGATFDRPGLNALLAAVEARPRTIDVLVVADLDRVGREQWEMGSILKRILKTGVGIWEYQKGTAVDARNAIAKFALTAQNLGNELQREKAAEHTRFAHRDIAKAGRVTGAACYGYRNVDHFAPTPDGRQRRVSVTREIVPAEAEVVRRIFRLCAEGLGYKSIADRLNREGVPSTVPRKKGAQRAWAASTVREILHRETYTGKVIWGQRRKMNEWGDKVYAAQPKDTWIVREDESLRIVSDAEWAEAHERLAGAKALYLRANDGKLHGRPTNGIDSKYLLTGLLKCSACGGSMIVVTSGLARTRRSYLACATNRGRGVAACPNTVWMPMGAAEDLILGFIEQTVLHADVARRAVEMILEAQRPAAQQAANVGTELARIEGEIANLTGALATGGDLPSIVDALRQREARRAELQTAVNAHGKLATLTGPAVQRLLADVSKHFADWRGLLRREPVQARQVLRKLLVDRLACHVDGRQYVIEGHAALGGILAAALPVKNGAKLALCAATMVTPGRSARYDTSFNLPVRLSLPLAA
jgi:site-specific DNA recombinase